MSFLERIFLFYICEYKLRRSEIFIGISFVLQRAPEEWYIKGSTPQVKAPEHHNFK